MVGKHHFSRGKSATVSRHAVPNPVARWLVRRVAPSYDRAIRVDEAGRWALWDLADSFPEALSIRPLRSWFNRLQQRSRVGKHRVI